MKIVKSLLIVIVIIFLIIYSVIKSSESEMYKAKYDECDDFSLFYARHLDSLLNQKQDSLKLILLKLDSIKK
jgi:hypothetical protein